MANGKPSSGMIDKVVHIDRRDGKRSVSEVLRVIGYDSLNSRFELESIYKRAHRLVV